jgi:hypothetical protein
MIYTCNWWPLVVINCSGVRGDLGHNRLVEIQVLSPSPTGYMLISFSWPYQLKWANWAIMMRQSVSWACALGMSFTSKIPWKWLHWQGLECLSCILRILHGYSLIPTTHHYVPITFLTLNWADQLAHFSWQGQCFLFVNWSYIPWIPLQWSAGDLPKSPELEPVISQTQTAHL